MFPVSLLTIRLAAAACALTAQLVHLWVLPGEFITWPLRGTFFLIVAMVQGALAVSLALGPGRLTLWLGALFNALVVAVWLFTRAVGVPTMVVFIREPFGWPDAIATAAELLLITLSVSLLVLRRQGGDVIHRTEPLHA